MELRKKSRQFFLNRNRKFPLVYGGIYLFPFRANYLFTTLHKTYSFLFLNLFT